VSSPILAASTPANRRAQGVPTQRLSAHAETFRAPTGLDCIGPPGGFRTGRQPYLRSRGCKVRAVADAMMPGARRGLVLGFAFLAIALIGGYELSGFILNNDVISLSLIAMVCVAGAFVLAILRNWRHGVYCLFAWLLFEDFVRKYAGNNMAIYFAKDILTAVVYLSFFLAYRRRDKELEIA